MKRLLLILSLCTLSAVLYSQQTVETDTQVFAAEIGSSDSISDIPMKDTIMPLPTGEWKPDPIRAVWMGAIIPGYGQIYNRSYWKLPIVYGTFMGCAYAIVWTNGIYTDYKTAYRDIATDPNYNPLDPTKSYVAILPKGYGIDAGTGSAGSMGGKQKYTTYLQSNMNSYRRYRDITIVAMVVAYTLSLIDAYVDAQLYDFDISTDLSMNIEPRVTRDPLNNRNAEIKVAFTLK